MKKIEIVLLTLILLGAFTVRLYRFNNPIADWHSWRQADTSAVSRNFITQGFDVLHPRYDDISNVQTGVDNPQGYRFVEFPVFNIAQAGLFSLFGILTLEEWGRVVSIIASLGSILFIFLLGRKYASSTAGLFAGGFFAFVPYSIYYGRTILPDPSMAMAILGGIYFFDLAIEKSIKNKVLSIKYIGFYLLAVLFTAAALLLKPYAIFFILPMVYLVWKKFRFSFFKEWKLWVFAIVSVLPLILWRLWESKYPEGVPSYIWLFNGGNIRFTGAFFYWIFAERISKLLLGYWGIAVILLGFLGKRKNFGFFLSFAISSLVYVVVIARGNVQHDYYQILIISTLAFFFGLGAEFLIHASRQFLNKTTSYMLLVICCLFMLGFGWYQVRDYFNINNRSIVIAGEAVDRLTPKNAKVIAPYDGDTSFLYQTKRKGWPSFEHSLEDLIKLGADYLVLVNPSTSDFSIGKKYKIVAATPQYILFDLHKKL